MIESRTLSVPNEILLPQVAEFIKEGRRVTIRVRGNSMNPYLVDRRDEVVLSPFTVDDLQVGAVILARVVDGRFILHRIVKVKDGEITMMGDGNWRGTECTDPEDVLGLVTSVVRKGKTVNCTSLYWKAYSRTWMIMRPLRRWLLAVWRRI